MACLLLGNGFFSLDSWPLCLSVGQPRFPKVAPWSGATHQLQILEPGGSLALSVWVNFPFTGGGAMPAFGAMQEPIPDFCWVYSKVEKILSSWQSRKPDHMCRWSNIIPLVPYYKIKHAIFLVGQKIRPVGVRK